MQWYARDGSYASPAAIHHNMNVIHLGSNVSRPRNIFVQGAAQIYVPNPHVICHCDSNAFPSFHTYELMEGFLWGGEEEKAQDGYMARSTQYVGVS